MATMIKCPFCGGLVDGTSEHCIHCGGPLTAKGKQPGGTGTAPSLCPNCKHPVEAGDIVCTKCGTNLLTGEKIVEERQKAKGTRGASVGRFLAYMIAVVVLVALAAALVMGAMYLMRDPANEARRLALSGNLAEASEVLQTHLRNTPEDVAAQFLLGQIYWQGQQYDLAAEAFETTARQGGPQEREALILAVLAAERKPETADHKHLLTLVDTAVQQRYSQDAELLKLQALLHGMEEEYQGQEEALREARIQGGEFAPALPGIASALAKELEQAEQYLDEALKTDVEDAATVVARALVHLMQGEREKAAALFETAGAITPKMDGMIKLQQGILYLQQEEPGKALSLLTDAKKLLPDDMRAAFFHGLCLQENKLFEEAITALEPITAVDNPYAGIAALQMAEVFMEQNNLDRAAVLVRQAGESGLNTARQATLQGRIYALQNAPEKAEQAYRRAISMTADYPAAHLELGLLLVNRGAVDAGLQELEQYLELATAYPGQMRANEIEVLVTQLQQTRQ